MLDCLTERGKRFIGLQREVQEFLTRHSYRVSELPGIDNGSDIMISSQEGTLLAVAEIKVRETIGGHKMTLSRIRKTGYLITYQKILDGAGLSKRLGVPFYVIAYIVPESTLCIWQITNNEGVVLSNIKTKVGKTQATCNGGEAVRLNALLDINESYIIRRHS